MQICKVIKEDVNNVESGWKKEKDRDSVMGEVELLACNTVQNVSFWLKKVFQG